MGAPRCGRWQLPAKPAYLRMAACRPRPTHLARGDLGFRAISESISK